MVDGKKIRFLALAAFLLVVWLPAAADAATAKNLYMKADACYQSLLKDKKRLKYRDRWQACIRKFEAVYRYDPNGSWAAAGLFMSGKLYWQLYGYSYRGSDKKEALDIFERVVKRYPKSQYRKRAAAEIRKIGQKESTKAKTRTAPSPVVTKKNREAKAQFQKGESCYSSLLKSTRRQKYRDNWLRCIGSFERAYKKDPSGPLADESLFMAGKLYESLHAISRRKSDKRASENYYARAAKKIPDPKTGKSKAAARAQKPAKAPPKKAVAPVPKPVKPPPEKAPEDAIAAVIDQQAKKGPAVGKTASGAAGTNATVQGLRFWSNPNYTRVVVDADRDTRFTHRLLNEDPSRNMPQRLYVDLSNSRLGPDIQKIIPINDNLLIDTRAGQYQADAVRVVIDLKSFKTYKIFSLRNPFRIVIDVWGETRKAPPAPRVSPGGGGGEDVAAGALAKQLALGVSRIVIDPGHGGKDFGAPGYLKGVHEKQIVLQIGKRLAKKVREKLGCEVIMTRDSDRYLTLEERTAIANTKNADLFVSIHTNSARNRNAYGIETFFLNLATDDDAILVAARENATSKKNISDLQTILSDLMQNAKINESSRLAGIVQKAVYGNMKKRYSRIKNKGVKQAPFYVLLGAQMPAILVETSFISNPRECRRLTNAKYQDHLCDGIIEGIRQYIRAINPTASFDAPGASGAEG